MTSQPSSKWAHMLGLPPTQDASHHQDYEPFLVGNPILNLHLPLESWVGGRSKVKHGLRSKIPTGRLLSPRRSHRFVLCRFDDCHHSGKQFFGILAVAVVRAYENPLVSLNKAGYYHNLKHYCSDFSVM